MVNGWDVNTAEPRLSQHRRWAGGRGEAGATGGESRRPAQADRSEGYQATRPLPIGARGVAKQTNPA